MAKACFGIVKGIRAIQRRPNLDLVGVWVHSDEKVGKDVGELATISATRLVNPHA